MPKSSSLLGFFTFSLLQYDVRECQTFDRIVVAKAVATDECGRRKNYLRYAVAVAIKRPPIRAYRLGVRG
jgi:hypothetical protein